MEILSEVFYFILTIGILVVVHELGHFLAAKLFRMRVDVFSIGFPPRAFGKKIGETDYCVSWIPIGGYVKIAGMVDESFDTDFLEHEPQPWEFRSKPRWQRAVVLSAGVCMNILFAILVFWGMTYMKGREVRPDTELGFVAAKSPAAAAGLKQGDKLLTINNIPIKEWDDIALTIYTQSTTHDLAFGIQRGPERMTLTLPRSQVPDISEKPFGILPTGLVPYVKAVGAGTPAEKIGLQPGDTLLAVNGQPVGMGSLTEVIHANAGKVVTLTWARGTTHMSSPVTPSEKGLIGVSLDAADFGRMIVKKYSLIAALPVGIQELKTTSVLFFTNIYKIIIGEASFRKSISGPVAIARMAKESAESGASYYIRLLGLLSISLALINILPFPALDGGHLAFLGYEAVFRREIPGKVKIAIQQVGFILLLVFMAFVIYNDVVKY